MALIGGRTAAPRTRQSRWSTTCRTPTARASTSWYCIRLVVWATRACASTITASPLPRPIRLDRRVVLRQPQAPEGGVHHAAARRCAGGNQGTGAGQETG